MSFSVEGQKCPVCDGYVFDNDDLVFCPVCGAPHHRECYAAVGHCGLEQYHGTENEYKRPVYNPKQDTNAKSENSDTQAEKIGQDATNAGFFDNGGFTPFGTPVKMFDPMGGVGKDEKIDGVEATKVRDYVLINTPRYLPKFKKLNKKNKLSWNWAAFLFPNAWFFYRKMYFQGALFFIMSLAAGLLTGSVNILLNSFPQEALKSYSGMFSYILENAQSLNTAPLYLSLFGLLLTVAISVVAGLTGDWQYRSSALGNIKKIVSEGSVDGTAPDLRRKGGVNMFLGMISLFVVDWIVNIVYTLL